MRPEPVVFASLASPFGPLHLAATGRGLVHLHLLADPEAFRAFVARTVPGPLLAVADAPAAAPATIHARTAVEQLEAFLTGARHDFDLTLDLVARPAWDRAVLEAVSQVRWGETASYGEIARRIGRPRAARAVGGAVGRNPVGLVIPCHRIIGAGGAIGGYGGDRWGSREVRLEIKRRLLVREGAWPPASMAPASMAGVSPESEPRPGTQDREIGRIG